MRVLVSKKQGILNEALIQNFILNLEVRAARNGVPVGGSYGECCDGQEKTLCRLELYMCVNKDLVATHNVHPNPNVAHWMDIFKKYGNRAGIHAFFSTSRMQMPDTGILIIRNRMLHPVRRGTFLE